MTDLPRNGAVRMERARGDFVKGVVRQDAPGMVYYPSLPELAETYDLVLSVVEERCQEDDWLTARGQAMTSSVIVPFSAAVDANPVVVKRAEIVAKAVEEMDDIVFSLVRRGLALVDKAISDMEDEEDPIKAIRALRSASQTAETLHRMGKQAYDPASVRPENTVNINVNTLQSSEEIVLKVAAVQAKAYAEMVAAGIVLPDLEGEIVEGDDEDAS